MAMMKEKLKEIKAFTAKLDLANHVKALNATSNS
jgi:hypothetical protein